MAKQIKSPLPDNLFERAIKGAEDFLARMGQIIAEFKTLGTQAKNSLKEIDFGKAEGVTELNKQIKVLEGNVKALDTAKKEQARTEQAVEKVRKEQVKTTKKIADLSDEELKDRIKAQQLSRERTRTIKNEIALENDQLGLLLKLNAANEKLRLERAKLTEDTGEQGARFRTLNAEIDANNAKIDELSDKQKTANQNVGAYSDGIKEAFESSESLTKATGDLAEIQGTLGGVLKAVNLVLRKNESQTDDNTKSTTKLGRTSQRVGNILKGSLVGLIVTAAGALGSFVTSTQEGQIQFESFTKQVIGGLNVILGRFKDLGDGLLSLARFNLEEASTAFTRAFRGGIVEDIKNVTVAVSDLVKTQFEAANASRAVQADIQRRIQLEEELREIYDDDTRGFVERQKAALELNKIYRAGASALDLQRNSLASQLDIARKRALIAIRERAGGSVDVEALSAQISASKELSEVILENRQLLGENNALIIDTQILDDLVAAETAFIQKETELNGQRLADRQKTRKLLFDEVEQEVDFLIDATAQIAANNDQIISNEKATFEQRAAARRANLMLFEESNRAVLDEIARTVDGVEGADLGRAFAEAVNVSDLNRRLKDLGSAEIPINRLLELFKEIQTQRRDIQDAGQILNEAITGGRESTERIQILKESNAEFEKLTNSLIELSQVDVSALSAEGLKSFTSEVEAVNDGLEMAGEDRERDLLSAEIRNLESRLSIAKEGSAEFLQIEEELLDKKLALLAKEEAAVQESIDSETAARDKAAKDREGSEKKRVEDRAAALNFLENALAANSEKRQEKLDAEIETAKNRQEEIQSAIEAGNEAARESLTQARKEEEQAALAKSQILERQKQQEAVLTLLKLISAYAGSGDPNATQRAARDLLGATALAEAFFFKGTERVAGDSQLTKVHSGRDGYRVAVDGSERIMTGDQNSRVGNLSNDILAEVGFLYRTGKLVPKGSGSGGSALAEAELRQVNKNLKDLPKKMPVANVDRDLITGIVSEVVKRGNSIKRTPSTWARKA